MTLSINSNASALAILQSLNSTTEQLNTTTSDVSTGLKVQTSADNPAVWSLAAAQKGELAALSNVSDGLNRAQSIADVAVNAGQTISDLLNQLKATALSADDPTQPQSTLQELNAQFQSLLGEIKSTVSSASFGGVNLLDGSASPGASFLATADGQSMITIASQNLSLGGALLTVTAGADLLSQTDAAAALSQISASIENVNTAVATLGAQADQVSTHASFVATLSDTLTTGVGGLVDADVAAESARLSALQVQQQLGTQALSIANQQPQVILNLLKG